MDFYVSLKHRAFLFWGRKSLLLQCCDEPFISQNIPLLIDLWLTWRWTDLVPLGTHMPASEFFSEACTEQCRRRTSQYLVISNYMSCLYDHFHPFAHDSWNYLCNRFARYKATGTVKIVFRTKGHSYWQRKNNAAISTTLLMLIFRIPIWIHLLIKMLCN